MAHYDVVLTRSNGFYPVFERKPELKQQTHYCPGCGHGIAHKLIAESVIDMGLQDKSIFVSPVGCSVFAYYYFDMGNVQAAHGRTPAVATALKRACPGTMVIGYQGDGDLGAIGTAEIIHAANRGEHISIFFVNNAIYGMTGGQMAPTTLVGQVSTTTPWGRRPNNEGFPLKISELLATLEAPVYIERVALNDNKNVMKTRRAIRKALELQRDDAGFTFVEILSPCPTIWKMQPVDARRWVGEAMTKQFPLAVFRDRKPEMPQVQQPPQRSVAEVLGIADDRLKGNGVAHGRELSLKIAGFGGQGVLLLGQMIAEMGMRQGMQVSWLPSYGPEMRSGSAHCHVRFANERIGSPLVAAPEVLIAMNEISLRKFGPQVARGGLILYNREAVPADFELSDVKIIPVPASNIADGLGSAKVSNVVMLGALIAETDCVPADTAFNVVKATVKNVAMQELNRKAFDAGTEYVKKNAWPEPVSQPDGFAG